MSVYFYSGKNKPAPKQAHENSTLIFSHPSEAVGIKHSYAILKEQHQAILEVLDRVNIGLCIVNECCSVQVFNSAAAHILDAKDGIYTDLSGQLRTSDGGLKAQILQLLSSNETSHENGTLAVRLRVPKRSNDDAYLVEVSPLRDTRNAATRTYSGALVTIIDPNRAQSFNVKRIAELLNLSNAEEKTYEGIVEGLSTPQIAERRGVRLETVKTQVKSMHRKIGTHNRADLIRLALAVDPPI